MPETFTLSVAGPARYVARENWPPGTKIEVRVNGAVVLTVILASDIQLDGVVQIAGEATEA